MYFNLEFSLKNYRGSFICVAQISILLVARPLKSMWCVSESNHLSIGPLRADLTLISKETLVATFYQILLDISFDSGNTSK